MCRLFISTLDKGPVIRFSYWLKEPRFTRAQIFFCSWARTNPKSSFMCLDYNQTIWLFEYNISAESIKNRQVQMLHALGTKWNQRNFTHKVHINGLVFTGSFVITSNKLWKCKDGIIKKKEKISSVVILSGCKNTAASPEVSSLRDLKFRLKDSCVLREHLGLQWKHIYKVRSENNRRILAYMLGYLCKSHNISHIVQIGMN